MSDTEHPAIPAPWVLVDDLTVDHAALILERLTAWLSGPRSAATTRCTRALSLGETDDPDTVASWVDATAARLRRRAQDSEL